MQIEKLMAGSYLLTHHQTHILIGFPPELVKLFFKRKLPIPTCWILPDRKISEGVSLYSTEFPFYHFLFFSNPKTRPPRLKVLGKPADLHINEEILSAALLGPSLAQLQQWNPAFAIPLHQELQYLALKNAQNEVLPVKHFLDPRPLLSQTFTEIEEGLNVRHLAPNTYEFQSLIDQESRILELPEEAFSPFPYSLATPNPLYSYSSLKILGGGNGFTPEQPCTGFLIEHQGIRLLIDAGPYIRQLLRHHGLNLSQIHALYLTHIHDDHSAGLTELLQEGQIIDLFSTPEIAQSAFQKLALLSQDSEEQIAKHFRFHALTPGQPLSYYGMTLQADYSIHSVPCIGLKLDLKSQGHPDFTLLYPSDTLKRERVQELYEKKVIDDSRYQNYIHTLEQPVDLLIYDSGAGILHADSKDLEQCHSKSYLSVHTNKLSASDELRYTLGRGGEIFPLASPPQPSPPASLLLEAAELLYPSPQSPLLQDAQLCSFQANQVLLSSTSQNPPVYLLLRGFLELHLSSEDSHSILPLVPGDLFGAPTLCSSSPKKNKASILSTTSALCLAFSEPLFQSCCASDTLFRLQQSYFTTRSFLAKTPFASELDYRTKNELAFIAREVYFAPNTTILTQGEDSRDFYIICEGSVEVIRNEKET
jgi:ribonuclease BN (tRNA processing enzyme)/CRP-like cAMP-binding protein